MGKTKFFVRALKAYKEQPGGMMGFLLVEVCVLLIAFCPLLFLTDSTFKTGAVLSAVLFILLVLPARQNAAAAMQNRMAGGKICTLLLIDPGMYLKKLLNGLKSTVVILLWSAPLIVLLLIAKRNISSGDVDGFTVYRNIASFGGDNIAQGLVYLALIAVSTLIPIIIGCALRSGARHAHALGRKELTRGHHGGLLLARLYSLITLIPLIIGLLVAASRYVPLLQDIDGTFDAILFGTLELPDTNTTLIIAGAGLLLTLPLLPLGSLITASYVNGLAGGAKE